MFRTKFLTPQARKNETTAMRGLRDKLTRTMQVERGWPVVAEGIRLLIEEYYDGRENRVAGAALQACFKAMDTIYERSQTTPPYVQCLPLTYLFLERMSFPDNEVPFLDTIGGLYYSVFNQPMLPISEANLAFMSIQTNSEDLTAIRCKGIIDTAKAFLDEKFENVFANTNRDLAFAYPAGVTTFKDTDYAM